MTLHTEYLIADILPAGEIHLLAGPSGAGKTTLLMQMIKDYLEGKPVFGYQTFPGQVFYVSCDRTLNEQKRVMDRTQTSWGSFEVAVLSQIVPKNTSPTIEAILRHVKAHQPLTKLLVVDGFATLTPSGKYMDYSTVSVWLRHCQDLCQLYDITILGVVHFAKEKKGEGYSNQRERILGSAAWGGFANLVLTLSKEDPEDATSTIRNLWICPRNEAEIKMKLKMEKGGKLVTFQDSEEDQLASILELELKKLPIDRVFQRKDVLELNAKLDLPVAAITVDRMLKRLVVEGRLEKAGQGKYRRVAEV